ncbi:MAG: hybrid sensor histidine kinase/response regulator [Desulfuromonadaceae bacterium]
MQSQTRWSTFRSSFQFKLFCIFTLITFLIAFLLVTLYITREIRTTRHEAAQHLQLLTEKLADAIRLPLYVNNVSVIRTIAEQVANSPEISTVIVSAPDGTILVKVQGRSAKTSSSAGSIVHTEEVHSGPLFGIVEESRGISDNTTGFLLGRAGIERSTDNLSREIRMAILFSATVAFIFWLTIALLSHLVLQKLTRSFNVLMHGIRAMQQGDFTSRIQIESDDEPARAARAINMLAESLQLRGEENLRLQAERLDFERQMLQTQKLESLGIMAGGIAHDFNNLLQSILGNMELAAMELDADSAPLKNITFAMRAAKRAALLTGLMLTYVGKGDINRKELNLNELVRENADLLKTATSAKIATELHLAPGLPLILADDAHIQQLVMNLITNAAEAITGRTGTVRITTGVRECDQAFLNASLLEEKAEAGRYVFLEVSDNGCGMGEDTLKRLFDPFFTTKFTGRGLGMSAVLGIMKTHCGALYVESTPGTGTTFRALFPALASQRAVPVQNVTATIPARATAENTSLTGVAQGTTEVAVLSGMALVVDDEKSVLKVCSKMVSFCGFTVITACDGPDAVAKFREHADEIEFVLMDLTMPHMDGITAMNELYRIRPGTRVILASGFNENELSGQVTGLPPSGFIRKPYNMAALETEIRRVMQKA